MSYRNYAPSNGFIVDKFGNGDFTSVNSAIAAATSGMTIIINPGTYTENVTLKAGVYLAAMSTAGNDNGSGTNVIIVGKCTFSTAGTVCCSGITFQTNSDFTIAVTGTGVSFLFLSECGVFGSNNIPINMNSTGAGSQLFLNSSVLSVTQATTAQFTLTNGILNLYGCYISNDGTSSLVATGTTCSLLQCQVFGSYTTAGTGAFTAEYTTINTQGNIGLTTAGTGVSLFNHSRMSSGSASCISVGAGSTVECVQAILGSNAGSGNVVAGTGNLNYGEITCIGSAVALAGTLTATKYTTL